MAQYFDRKEDYGYIRWAQDVKRRDNYACVICNRKGILLNSHHLNSWSDHPSQRYDVGNGVTLCSFHHDDFHEKYGKGGNTEAQFKEYREIAEGLIKVANIETIKKVTVKKMLQRAEKDRELALALQFLDGYNSSIKE